MKPLTAILGGLVGGAIGAAVWTAIAVFANIEFGWIAWGIGALVGFGVALGSGREGGSLYAAIAVAIAVLSIAGGKYASVVVSVNQFIAEEGPVEITEEVLITFVCDELLDDADAKREPITWDDGSPVMGGYSSSDYPEALWQQATDLWASYTPQYQSEFSDWIKAQEQSAYEQYSSQLREDAFKHSFSFWDILWFGLAIFTAFKLGFTGGLSDDE